jgi:WD40 repeat protein
MHGVAKDELEGEDIRQHRRTRRLARAGVSALAALVVISIVLGAIALHSRNQAVVSRNEAVSIGNIARARALAAESQNELTADPLVSVLLARRAVAISPIPQAVAALRQAIDASAVRLALPTESGKECGFQSGPAIAYSPAGDRIAESLCTGDIVVHDAKTGTVVYRRHLSTEASAVAYSANGRYLAVGTNTGIDLLDPNTGRRASQLVGHGEPNALAFSPDSTLLAATTDLGTTVYDVERQTARFSSADPRNVQTVAFAPDQQSLVVGTTGDAEVIDVATGKIVRTLSPPGQTNAGGVTNPIALAGDLLVVGQNVAAPGGVGFAIDLWDTKTWTMRSLATTTTGTNVSRVAVSSDGHEVAFGNYDGTGGVWSADRNEQLVTLSGQTAAIGTITFSPDGKQVATASNDGTARIFRAGGPWLTTQTAVLCACGNELGWQQHTLVGLARSDNDVVVRKWAQPSGRAQRELVVGVGQESLGAALSRDGKLAALWHEGGGPTTVSVTDTATGRQIFTLPATVVAGLAFSDDNRLLVVSDAHDGLHVATLATRHTIVGRGWSKDCHDGGGVAISADGRLAAVYTFTGHVCIGHTDTATPFATFSRPGQLSSAAFSPDGKRLALGSWDSTVAVLDIATVKPALQLVGHTRGVNGVAFSPDGRYIASTSSDNTLRVWDATTGQVLQIDLDNSNTEKPTFSPDSQMVAEVNADDSIRVWSVCSQCDDPAALLASSRASVISPLTPLEHAVENQFSNPTLSVVRRRAGSQRQ